MEMKFDFNDILIKPSSVTDIDSRSEVNILDENGMLPLFTAPMLDVVGEDNYKLYNDNNIYSIIPRKDPNDYKLDDLLNTNNKKFLSLSLDIFNHYFNENKYTFYLENNIYILIDIANGHMSKLIKSIRNAKKLFGDKLVLMVGNIANPDTYHILSDAGADYIRLGIGNGNACLTTEQSAVGYPMASLIEDTHNISLKINNPAKIVADGGMKSYSDIIKSLALGADYVMVGSLFNKALESSGKFFNFVIEQGCEPYYIEISVDEAISYFRKGYDVFKEYKGMSTKDVQKILGNKILKTSEGIKKYNKVEYDLKGWTENFNDYLKSTMSYCGKRNLNDFIGRVEYISITNNAFKRFNK